jgi:hypothetical protein
MASFDRWRAAGHRSSEASEPALSTLPYKRRKCGSSRTRVRWRARAWNLGCAGTHRSRRRATDLSRSFPPLLASKGRALPLSEPLRDVGVSADTVGRGPWVRWVRRRHGVFQIACALLAVTSGEFSEAELPARDPQQLHRRTAASEERR